VCCVDIVRSSVRVVVSRVVGNANRVEFLRALLLHALLSL
jgi:hypothetical protein